MVELERAIMRWEAEGTLEAHGAVVWRAAQVLWETAALFRRHAGPPCCCPLLVRTKRVSCLPLRVSTKGLCPIFSDACACSEGLPCSSAHVQSRDLCSFEQ
jgi:hypothetical protein